MKLNLKFHFSRLVDKWWRSVQNSKNRCLKKKSITINNRRGVLSEVILILLQYIAYLFIKKKR